jgi:hypothetical protein
MSVTWQRAVFRQSYTRNGHSFLTKRGRVLTKEICPWRRPILKESDPFVRHWLEVIEDGSIEAILEFLDSID